MKSNAIYFTTGPSELFFTVEHHIKRALQQKILCISHRSKKFMSIVSHTNECLKELLDIPANYHIFFVNSANEVWDRITQNLIIKHSHHFVNGAFGKKFYDFVKKYKKLPEKTFAEDGIDFSNFEVSEKAELIAITLNETSTGYMFDTGKIVEMKEKYPDKIVAIDVVSAVPCIPIDFSVVDTAYFSVQKGFGLPSGLGVWICNDKTLERAKKNSEHQILGSYRSLPNLHKFSSIHQTPETPNMLGIYLLGKVAEDMIGIGRKKVINDTIYKSIILNDTIEKHPLCSFFVKTPQRRSPTITVADSPDSVRIIESLAQKGLLISNGYADHKNRQIRIANFFAHSKESVEMLCDELKEIAF